MKKVWMVIALIMAWNISGWAAVPPGQEVSYKWYKKAKGYEEALALQKEIGADMFVYISNGVSKSSKGLCRWFETKGLKNQVVSRFLRKNYIKVELIMPSNKDTQALGKDLHMSKGPSVIIIQPNGRSSKINPFDWSMKEPRLKEGNVLVEEFTSKSSTFEDVPETTDAP